MFLLSLKAGGTGLNLTRADHVVHFDRWWNPAVEDQATDRAYRIGQTRPVQVHRLITEGTVEERIAELLRRKRSLADAVLGRGEAALTELSNDELRDLVVAAEACRERAVDLRRSRSAHPAAAGDVAGRDLVGPGLGPRGRGGVVRRRRPARRAGALAQRRHRRHHRRRAARSWRRSTTAPTSGRSSATVPELDPVSRRAFVEVVAGESGHLAALLAGELPHRLVEQSEEAGVELLPYGGELGSACPCGAWVDPCVHALAVLLQVAWLVDGDPWVLLRLRGLAPDDLQAELAAVPADDAGHRCRTTWRWRWTPRSAPLGWWPSPTTPRPRSATCSEGASAPHGVQDGVLDRVRRAVGADHGLGVGLSARLVEPDLLGELPGVEVPAVEVPVLVVGDRRAGDRVDRDRVDAPLVAGALRRVRRVAAARARSAPRA